MILSFIIALIWGGGALVRIRRQARFYQIEEYKSGRYAAWLLADWRRGLPRRAWGAFLVGAALAFATDTVPGGVSVLPYFFGIVTALIAVYPPAESEIKKPLRMTNRAKRLLGAAFAFAIALLLVFLLIFAALPLPEGDRFSAIFTGLAGLLTFLLAPLCLMLGNLTLLPIEARIRQGYLNQARATLDIIQPRIIGLTGSYGKTTTKHFLHHILNGRYKTYATPKSYNTEMGVTLAINRDLSDDYSVEAFIVEMGMYEIGEIARICALTPPDVGIVIEVGPQHLERAGSIENIARAKYEIIEGTRADGTGIFNYDNTYVREMFGRDYPRQRIAVSRELTPEAAKAQGVRFVASDITETLEGISFSVIDTAQAAQETMQAPVNGIHNVTNLLLAIATAVHEGMTLREIGLRVRSLQPAESRLVRQVTASGITIINDSYSTNPVGAVSALRVLGMHTTGKRLLITPGMVELGDEQDAANHKLGEIATQYATDIVLVGAQQTQAIQAGIAATDFPRGHLQIVETLAAAVAWYETNLHTGDTVLFLNDLPDTY